MVGKRRSFAASMISAAYVVGMGDPETKNTSLCVGGCQGVQTVAHLFWRGDLLRYHLDPELLGRRPGQPPRPRQQSDCACRRRSQCGEASARSRAGFRAASQ